MSLDAKRHREVGDEIIRLVGLKGQNWRKVVITLEAPSPRISVSMDAWAEVPPVPVLPTFDEWVVATKFVPDGGLVCHAGDFRDCYMVTRGHVPGDVFNEMTGAPVCRADERPTPRRQRHYPDEGFAQSAIRAALLRLGQIRE